MATPIKRIEKDFLLKVLYDEQIPVMHLKSQTQYILTVEKPTKGNMFFKADRPIEGLRAGKKLDLMFDYRGQVIIFNVEIISSKEDQIVAVEPEFLFKNLDRSFSRVSTPQDLQVQFTFLDDRYSLSYPKVSEFETMDAVEIAQAYNVKNLSGLTEQLSDWIKNYATGHKLVIFKNTKPASHEERILSETGRSLYIPSTLGSLPTEDPFPKKRLITEDTFKRYLESNGVDIKFVDDALARFIKHKHEAGIFSDLWVPVLFQEYVIGYLHVWIDKEGMLPLDHVAIDSMYQFAKILAYSLKVNGYFESGKIKNEPFEGKIMDISASGFLFSYPLSSFAKALMLDSELAVQLQTERRTVNANARIVRRYVDKTHCYFGCRFINLEPENMRFLFEYIYGKPFTDTDASFLSGQV
ncbi:MAG: PilZ domain-containing protein [Treponema sp.]|nr:PilZ domain-containing protein [Treponema sp.]